MSWRPDGWDTLDIYAATECISMTATDLIEAGADAMLEALFDLAKESPTKTFTIDSRVVHIYESIDKEGK